MSDNTADKLASHEPALKDGSQSFGSFYPKHYVLAIFDTDDEARRAGTALSAAGFAADDVIVASGADVVAHEQQAKAEQSVFAKLGEQWSKLYTDESDVAHKLMDAARKGAAFVLAYAPEDDQTQRATAVLKPMHPPILRKYDALTVSDLA